MAMAERLPGDAYRIGLLQVKAVREGMIHQMEIFGDMVKAYLTASVSNWTNKPGFDVELAVGTDMIIFDVIPKGDSAINFVWVDRGTGQAGGFRRDKYPIRPKGEGYPLRFQSNYNAKTQPTGQVNVGDGSRSGDWIEKYLVRHPGIRPREITKTVMDEIEEMWPDDFDKTISEFIARTK